MLPNRVLFIVWLTTFPVLSTEAQVLPRTAEDLLEDEDVPDVVTKPPGAVAPDGILPVSEVGRVEYGPSDRTKLLLHERMLVLVTGTGAVEARHTASGEFAWKLGLPGEVLFPPVVLRADPFEILLSSPSGKMLVVEGTSGNILKESSFGFELALPPYPAYPAHPAGSRLFLGTPSGLIVAMDLETGAERFRVETGEKPLAFALAAGLLVVSGGERTLTAVEAESGAIRWTLVGRAAFAAPAVFREDADRIYIGDEAGEFYCLSADKGNVRFRWSTGATIRSQALVVPKRVYVTSFGNVLYAFDSGGGAEQWRLNLPGRPASGPVLVGKRILVATFDGALIEVNPEQGQLGKSYSAPGELSGPPSFWVVAEPPAAPAAASAESLKGTPLWYEGHRIALTLRSGQILLLAHDVPEPDPEAPDLDPEADPKPDSKKVPKPAGIRHSDGTGLSFKEDRRGPDLTPFPSVRPGTNHAASSLTLRKNDG